MKALHLKGADNDAKLYHPTEESRTESHVFAPAEVDQAQSPAVLQKRGVGHIGYIGDVNNEEGSQVLLKSILGRTTV